MTTLKLITTKLCVFLFFIVMGFFYIVVFKLANLGLQMAVLKLRQLI